MLAVQASAQTVTDPTRPAGPDQNYAAGQETPAGQAERNDSAQQPGQRPGQNQFARQPGQQGQSVDLNQAIAGCLLLGNQEEVALAEFAQSRTQNPKVKQFAQMMIQDHEQAIAKLTRVAPELAEQAASLREGQGRGQTGRQNDTPGTSSPNSLGQAGAAAAGNQVFALQKRVTEECLQLTQQELGQKQGAEFDKCYMSSQVGAHIGMLAKLRGSQQFASGELKQVIQEAEQTVQKHLEHAKIIAKEVEQQAAPRQTSQRPGVTQPAVR
jgi:predicted outer membrane protein